MEASVAGDGQQAAEGQEAQQQAQLPPEFQEQLAAMGTGLEQLRQVVETRIPQQQEEGEPEPEPLDLSFLDPTDPEFDPGQVAPQFQSILDRALDANNKQWEQRLGPINESLTDLQHTHLAEQLIDQYPDLADPQVHGPVADLAVRHVQTYGWPQEIAQDPRFLELIYIKSEALRRAEQEQESGGSDQQAAHLESSGGAAPTGGEGDRFTLAQGKLGRRVLPNP